MAMPVGPLPAVRAPGRREARGRPRWLLARALDLLRLALLRRDLDPVRLELLGLWDPELEDAVLQGRLDGVRAQSLWDAEAPLEAAEPALHATECAVPVLGLIRERPRPAHSEDVVLELDLEVLRTDSRDIHVDGDTVVVLEQVGGRGERSDLALARSDYAVEFAQPVGERLYKRCHAPPSVVLRVPMHVGQSTPASTSLRPNQDALPA